MATYSAVIYPIDIFTDGYRKVVILDLESWRDKLILRAFKYRVGMKMRRL